MPECPTFLNLPARSAKPRSCGITHVLDSGLTPDGTRDFLGQAGHLVDIVKVGWGIGYVNPSLGSAGADVHGARLPGVAGRDPAGGGRAPGPGRRAAGLGARLGITHLEVSNGLRGLPDSRKHALVRELSADFVVLAETGAKTGNYPPTPAQWAEEMALDLDAGASWVIAEGRESGTVGLYHADQGIRQDLVTAILDRIPPDKVIFEAPGKSQQAWFIQHLGADVNMGNIAPASVLSLETLRLGLRADTAPSGARRRYPGQLT